MVDLLYARDIGLDGQRANFSIANRFGDELLRRLQSLFIAVGENYLGAPLTGEGDCCSLTDAYNAISEIAMMMCRSISPEAAPVMRHTPG